MQMRRQAGDMIKTLTKNFTRSFVLSVLLSGWLSLFVSCNGGRVEKSANKYLAYVTAIQDDGKILVAGASYGNFWNGVLLRFNSNGIPDKGFGSDGKSIIKQSVFIKAITIQNDDKIVAAGYNSDTSDFVVIRWNNNGSFDTHFGTGGIVQTAVSSTGGGLALALAVQDDGRIVVAGGGSNGLGYDFVLVRYNTDGKPDDTFGTDGRVITPVTDYMITGSVVSGLALQDDGKLLAAGGSCIIRYNTDGSLDTTFGDDGKRVTGSYYEQTSSVAVLADGKILAAGSSYNGNGSYDLAVSRFNSDGSPDTDFADNGRVVIPIMSLYTLSLTSVMADPDDGKIVVTAVNSYQSIIARFKDDGSLDESFADSGILGANGQGYFGGAGMTIQGAAVQPDGKVVVAGYRDMNDSMGSQFAVARFNSDGNIDTGFGIDGMATSGM